MARAGLLDVPRDESGQAQAGRALRVDLQPQFRRPSGLQGPHPPCVARDGGRSRHRRPLRRYSRVALIVSARHSAALTPIRVPVPVAVTPTEVMAAIPTTLTTSPPNLGHALIRHRMLDIDVG